MSLNELLFLGGIFRLNAETRHTKDYLSILSHLSGNEVWFELAVLADNYLLNDSSVTARIVGYGRYSQFEIEEAKKKFTETEYQSLESYGKVGSVWMCQ